jgi:small subunit ribosomal protein S20
LKRARQSEVRKARNRVVKTKIKNAVKSARAAVGGEPPVSESALKKVMSTLHKASSKGVIHPRNAARRIARLAKQFHQAAQAAKGVQEPQPANA